MDEKYVENGALSEIADLECCFELVRNFHLGPGQCVHEGTTLESNLHGL